jgi:4-alpha-glucanotransferase
MIHTSDSFMVSASYEQALDRAARLWGIEPEYRDTWGHRHVATPEIEKAILTAMGVDAETAESLDRAAERRLLDEWSSILPPVFVAGQSAWGKGIPLHLPASLAGGTAAAEFRWEDGGTERRQWRIVELAGSGRAELQGIAYLRKRLPMPQGARLGYHDVSVSVQGPAGETRRASMRLILCPDRAYTPPAISDHRRAAGLAIALYGLRSERNWGCGDLTDLEVIINWAVEELGCAFIGLNPLHAIANRQPFNISPYLPASAFYKNAIYLDVERISDFRLSKHAARWREKPEVVAELSALRSSPFVEYERVWALKLHALKLAFTAFLWHGRGSARARAFEEYTKREGTLLDRFATWCALDEWIRAHKPGVWIWPEWPEEYQEPESAATRAFAKKHWRLVLFYKYVQWQMDVQLEHAQRYARERGLSIGLYHDLALATDRCGADLWAHRPFYVSGCRVGAPPDGFSPKGQDWSFPPPDSQHHRATGYQLFAESIRRNCRHGGALRIDHVMRFFRLYWIPALMDPAHGAYVRDRWDELLLILALESVREKVVVVGEDLGTVTSEIRQALDHFGLYGYKVPYFEKDEHGGFRPPGQYPERAMISSSTHDLPTLAGFWTARDIEVRHDAGLLDEAGYHRALGERAWEKQTLLGALFAQGLLPEWFPRHAEHVDGLTGELHNALAGWLAMAPCRLLAINQEDLLKETEQQNLPATTSEHPNWRRRMRFTVEELRDGAARDYTRMFRSWLDGRQPAQ